jgi:multicomponent Na+:H+ antiporter subunit E
VVSLIAIVARVVVFSAMWWGLTEGALESWLVGVPVVLAATVSSYRLRASPVWRWNLLGAIVFALLFLLKSLRAGVDVAWRAVTRDVAPQVISYQVVLRQEAAITFFAGIISLLPGTLTTSIDGDRLQVHTLDARKPYAEDLARLEALVAAMFAERI